MKKFLIALGALGAAAFIIFLLEVTKPEAAKKAENEILPEVEVALVEPGTVTMTIPSQGMVMPRRETRLTAEVSGKIIDVSPKFAAGQAFAKDEILARIEDADYRTALANAKANVANAQLNLSTEQARSEQALRDWKSLGRSDQPSDLTARKPQLAVALANLESAKEAAAKAQRDLDRTLIRAPFDAVISSVGTELGSFVTLGSPLAEIYTPAPYEVRLPLSLDEMRFIQKNAQGEPSGSIEIFTQVGNESHRWTGQLARSEGQVEQESRSIYLVATVEGHNDPQESIQLQPGLFVQATVSGRPVENLLRVPFTAFLDLERVVVVDPDDRLQYRTVEVVRREANDVLIASGGLKPGDRVALTKLSNRIPGMKVAPQLAETHSDELTETVAP